MANMGPRASQDPWEGSWDPWTPGFYGLNWSQDPRPLPQPLLPLLRPLLGEGPTGPGGENRYAPRNRGFGTHFPL